MATAIVEPPDLKLEVVVLGVSDVDRAKAFYEKLGWRLDADYAMGDNWRVVQMTPHNSDASIIFGKGIASAKSGLADGLVLAVGDLDAARDDLIARGVNVSEVFHYAGGVFQAGKNARVEGRDPQGRSYLSFASFEDPDGNGWLLQEVTTRAPGREWKILTGTKSSTIIPKIAQHTLYRTVKIDGLSIFYREAGSKEAPALLLLHGLPSSSRMFEPLLARLADQFHMIAPDFPGFGHSDAPPPQTFSYTFDNIARVMDRFTEVLNLTKYTLYMQDYGGPVGFRMALVHPDRVEALIVQNAVAHNEGLGAPWKTRRAFWADRAAFEAALRTNLLSLEATRKRHIRSDPNPEKYDPDLWTDEYAFLNKPGEADVQSDLFYDYRTNVDAYPKWQVWMQKTQPRLLVLWGKYDSSFELTEPEAYRRDVPTAQVHLLDGGHFALDTAADEIADLVRRFMLNKQ
jgi:pimeloyl-ACP methyl ester carboxylesterase/predicted enzyme related to lactoylglutathione lyase